MANFINQNQEFTIIFGIFIVTLLFVWNGYLQYQIMQIRKKSRIFLAGKDGTNLEGVINAQVEKSGDLAAEIAMLNKENQSLKENLAKCVQKVGIVRFNPFGEVGGNQSFAIAILDNFLSGVIILSLYSREGMRVYAKPVKDGKSEYKLSKEEEEAVKVASGK